MALESCSSDSSRDKSWSVLLCLLTGGPANPAGPGGPVSPLSPWKRKNSEVSSGGSALKQKLLYIIFHLKRKLGQTDYKGMATTSYSNALNSYFCDTYRSTAGTRSSRRTSRTRFSLWEYRWTSATQTNTAGWCPNKKTIYSVNTEIR